MVRTIRGTPLNPVLIRFVSYSGGTQSMISSMDTFLPWAQWLTVPTPRLPFARSSATSVMPDVQRIRRAGEVVHSQRDLARDGRRDGDHRERVVVGHLRPHTPLLLLPGRPEIDDPAGHLAHGLVGLAVRVHPGRRRIVDPHRPHEGLRVEGIGLKAQDLADAVLEQAVDDDDIGPHELLAAGHPLAGDRAVMGHELEIQPGDAAAGVALARRRPLDVTEAALEHEVAALDHVPEAGTIHGRRGHPDERGVPLELGELERWAQRPDDGVDEVGQDVLGVVELHVGQVAAVPRDVSDDQTGRLGPGEHQPGSLPLIG